MPNQYVAVSMTCARAFLRFFQEIFQEVIYHGAGMAVQLTVPPLRSLGSRASF